MDFRKQFCGGLFCLSLMINNCLGSGIKADISDGATSLPNSCIDLPDGEHWLKLLSGDDYPVILATCSNGYTLINYDKDTDWSKYFSSFLKWHYKIGGPSQNDHYNWAQWYLPDDTNTNYIISPNCDVCSEDIQLDYYNKQGGLTNNNDDENENDESLLLQSGYYMTANLFGCFTYPRGMPDCDFNINTYECTACYTENFGIMKSVDWNDDDMTDFGACMTYIYGAYNKVDTTFDECTDQTENGYKPTIGLDGEFCVCTKPSASQYISITQDEINNKKLSLQKQAKNKQDDTIEEERIASVSAEDQTFYLYSKDFEKGTLRIKEPGTYILMEDIEFDWNPSTKDEPNARGAWFPDENDENYPGYGDTRDTFFMGWFAGITIECNNVILNLNGHELKQSKEFFYQQGFFSVIEVESQPFIPGQGVGFFGSDPVFPENVVIKNGNIGRTSHHCIHGNYNKNLLIEDINCYDFSTHGIQLNGFDGVTLRNVDIGPSNTEQYLSSEYTHYRFILDRLRKIAENNPTGTIKFDGREPITMSDIADELELKMNLAFKYVVYGEECSEDDELYDDFQDAISIFVNENGLGYGASQYGLFLSYPGANVLSFHLNSQTANDATLENVKIHDLHHKTKEYTGIRTTLRLFVNSFNAPLHLKYLLGDEKFDEIINSGPDAAWDNDYKYVGNILTDATLAMTELNDDWGLNQIMFVKTDELTAWAKGDIDGGFNGNQAMFLCSIDGMIHSVKGTFGLRIDGVNNVNIDGLDISNIEEDSPMGYGICGFCDQCAFESRSPYSVDYAGNWAHGISIDYSKSLTMQNINVNNIKSQTGRTNGITLWPGVTGIIEGDITVSNIFAGTSINKKELQRWQMPNSVPQSCGIQVYEENWGYQETDNDHDISSLTYDDNVNIKVSCVSGGNGCWNEDKYTMHGHAYDCDGIKDEDALYKYTIKYTAATETETELETNINKKMNEHESVDSKRLKLNKLETNLENINESEIETIPHKGHGGFIVFCILLFFVIYWVVWTLKCKENGYKTIGSIVSDNKGTIVQNKDINNFEIDEIRPIGPNPETSEETPLIF